MRVLAHLILSIFPLVAIGGVIIVKPTSIHGSAAGCGAITVQPVGTLNLAGQNYTMTVTATSASSYQWRKTGTPIGGATTSSLAFSPLATGDMASYDVQITSTCGNVLTSSSASLWVTTTTTVSNWVALVCTNGGAFPSSTTISAMDTFWNGLVTDSISSKMINVCCFVPDNLIASTTPLVATSGNSLWVNHNFVSGDLTVNGLKGNTTTKYLDTGVNASTALTLNSTAIFAYVTDVGTAAGVDIGTTIVGNTSDLLLISDLSGTTYSDQYNATGGGRQSTATHGAGYYCGSRTSSSVHNIYYAKVGSAHASISSSATTGGSLPNFTFYAFAENNGGSPAVWADLRSAASGIASGLSSADSGNLYSRLATLLTAIGGTNP